MADSKLNFDLKNNAKILLRYLKLLFMLVLHSIYLSQIYLNGNKNLYFNLVDRIADFRTKIQNTHALYFNDSICEEYSNA